jgi:LCP family protein required for cell wall assembly
MTHTQRVAVALLCIATCALSGLVAQASVQAYQQWFAQPWGPALPVSGYTPLGLPATWTPWSVSPVPAAREATLTAVAPRCGGPAVMSLLLIGSDTRSGGYTWGLSDLMRIARVDFTTPRLTVLDFPRDLWVAIPEIADDLNGQDHEKLNQAYLYGNPGDGFGYWADPSAGPGLLARTLEINFGGMVDHYIAVDMQTFVRVVDAVDGLDVTLDRPVRGSHNPDLKEGTHHLDGAEALALARSRSDGVFSRGENQNVVLCALQKQLTSPSVVPRIPDLVRSFQGSVKTDLSPELMSQLICLARQMPRENITLYNFPEDLFTGTRVYDPVFEKEVFIWDVEFLILRNYVTEFQAGRWPEPGENAGSAGTAAFCR